MANAKGVRRTEAVQYMVEKKRQLVPQAAAVQSRPERANGINPKFYGDRNDED